MPEQRCAGFWVRIAAGVYDGLLVLALWVIATALLMPIVGGAISPHTHWYQALLLLLAFPFFGWFWTHGGQTLGMRAWRLRVSTHDGADLDWTRASIRYAASVVGVGLFALGLLWCLVDRRRRALQDIVSRTEVVRLPKNVV